MTCYFDYLSAHKINLELAAAEEQVELNKCLYLPYIEHGYLSKDINYATVTCDEGYRFSNGRKSVKFVCEEGEWNPKDIQCTSK